MPSTTHPHDVAAAPRAPWRGPAMEAALSEIERAFGAHAIHDGLKRRIRKVLRKPDHPAVAARYGARAVLIGYRPIDVACDAVEQWYRQERKAFQTACAYGQPSRLSLEVLRELRLILRWMRFNGMAETFVIAAAEMRARAA